jgi:predicted HD phosphohydrolase
VCFLSPKETLNSLSWEAAFGSKRTLYTGPICIDYLPYAGESEEMIVAILLHDIGDELATYSHSEMAAAIQRPFVSEKLYWIVKHHGVFQMYYYAHHCGGDQNCRDMYRDHAWYQDGVDFCHNYDQNCFDPEYDSEPLELFEPILHRIMATPSFKDSAQMARYGNSQSNADL